MQPTEPSKMYLVSPLLNLGKLSIRMHRKGILNNYHTQLHYFKKLNLQLKLVTVHVHVFYLHTI